MDLNRRSFTRSVVCSGVIALVKPLTLLSQSIPPDGLEVIAAVLRAQCPEEGTHALLIARERFGTEQMKVLEKNPTPMERASHQVQLPYLSPPPERMAAAYELATAYNRSLERPASSISEGAAFNFKYRLLDPHVAAQFETLYPGGNVYSEELERKRRAVSRRYRLFFDGSTTLWTVSRVAFASGGALAVAGLRSSGGSCWMESWHVLERSEGAWHDLHWGGALTTCA